MVNTRIDVNRVSQELKIKERQPQAHGPTKGGKRSSRVGAKRTLMSAGLALGVWAGMAQEASAQVKNWTDPNGGSAGDAANWSPVGIPTAANDLIFNIASVLATIPVTFPLAANASASQTFRQESYTLTMSSPHTTSGAVQIGLNATDVAAATLTTGQWNVDSLSVGQSNGADGTMSINDDDASVTVSGATVISNGTLSITGGGLFDGNNTVSISDGGVVSVAGQLVAPPFTRSRFEGPSVNLTGTSSASTFNVTSGALATISNLNVGLLAGGTGTVNIQAGALAPATIQATSSVSIGRNIGGTAAGAGTMNVNSAGVLDVDGTLFVAGDPQGGTGTLHTEGTGMITTNSLSIGAGATLDLDGGSVDIDGGTLTYTNPATHLVLGGANTPVVKLINAAQGTLGVVTGGRVLTVGSALAGAGLADLHLRSGSGLICTGLGGVVIGEQAGDDGRVFINNAGSTFTMPSSQVLTVGLSGFGRFDIQDNAQANLGLVFIANNPGSIGQVLINAGVTVSSGAVFVGGSTASAGGNGSFSVLNGSSANVVSANTDGVKVWPQGELEIRANSLLTADKPVRIAGGILKMNGGPNSNATLTAPQLLLESGSLFEVNPTSPGLGVSVNADTAMTGTATLDLFGDLTVGNAASTTGFSGTSTTTINLHGNTLTILDSNGSGVGNINLTSVGDPAGSLGTVIAAQPLNIAPGADITGAGTFAADIAMQSAGTTMTMTGAGITIDGLLTNNPGGAISGPASSVLQFLTSGGYTGNGTIAARVNAHVKSTITATGNLTMGLNTTSGVTIDGVLKCGTNLVTLIDSNGVTLGTKTEFINTILTQNITLGVSPKSIFQGMGTVDTGLLSLNGNIKPGDTDAAGPETDTITCTGDVQIGAQAEYLCHLGPPGFGEEFPQSDRIQTNGAGDVVQINGGTLDVQLLPFYTPVASDSFDVVKGFAGVSGFFDTHILPPGARVSYLPSAVRVHFCYPDCDGDNALTIDDFICFQTEFALGLPEADCDADAFLSIDDFICFQTFFAIGC